MNAFITFTRSSVGKKLIVGLTGVLLCSFLVIHLIGNLLLFKNDDGEAFNAYAEFLPKIFLIRIIEILLFAIFALHILTATIVWFRNKQSRPSAYEVKKPHETSSLTSRIMFITGSTVFIFLVIHLRDFWYEARVVAAEGFDMYQEVRGVFADWRYDVLYLAALVLLTLHLHHGFQSALQTFGVRNAKYVTLIEWIGVIFWLLLPLGFASMPVYFYLFS